MFQKKKKMTLTNHSQTPNWFLAIPFNDNEKLCLKMKQIQNHITHKEPKLIDACVPIEKAHLTLFVFYTENIEKVIEILKPVLQNYKLSPMNQIKVENLGHFRNQTLFAHLNGFNEEFKILWKKIGHLLVQNDIIHPKEIHEDKFKPHLSLMRLSLMKSRNLVKMINPALYQDFNQIEIGVQSVQEIQVLSRTKPTQPNGHYHCEYRFQLQK